MIKIIIGMCFGGLMLYSGYLRGKKARKEYEETGEIKDKLARNLFV